MKPIIFGCLFLLVSLPSRLLADTWEDPSFKEMLEGADLIGVFRVVEGGTFKARVVPVALYKGKVSGEIWLGGFSNKYGPIDTLAVGETYLLFITKVKKTKSRYGSWSNAGDQSIAKASYEAATFVRSQKNGYFVPTPTSGEYRVIDDKVFLDLAEVNRRISGFPVEDIKHLVASSSNAQRTIFSEHCNVEIRKNISAANVYLVTNYLAALTLAGDGRYDALYEKIASDSSWQTRFTLTKLLGVVKGQESRNVLISMLHDAHGAVQGEVIRQLAKRESASTLGARLVTLLDSASSQGLYPSLMSPVRNEYPGGKIQIIETLAQLNYKPAIPYLLPLLKTNDDYIFKRTLDALIQLGSTEFVGVLNDRLYDPELSSSALYAITNVIESKNLIACKDGLFVQLKTPGQSGNDHKATVLATLATLAAQDPSIEALIAQHFQHFFTYYDTLGSADQKKWMHEYLNAFTKMKSEQARPLVYRALYEWSGLDPARFTSLQPFMLKQGKEDSLRTLFPTLFVQKGYVLKGVIYFYTHVARKQFIIAIKLPDNNPTFELRKSIADAIGIEEEGVFLQADAEWHWLDHEERFVEMSYSSLLDEFMEYAKACPHETDLKFLRALMASSRWEKKELERELTKTTVAIEAALSSQKH